MKQARSSPHTGGFTLVELLVTVAVMAFVFGGLFGSVQLALKLIGNSKAITGATSLANEKLEYIRSLAYGDVGTEGGIPSGLIPQNATTSLNGIVYHERVLIAYVDSPEDGLGGGDVNGILADYKQVKVEYSWATPTGTSTIFLITNVVPPGIESTDGGGTLMVNVFDTNVQPVSGAEVHIYNTTTTSTINTARFTNVDGVAMFAGAPAAANYEITVTKNGYSTDQTYSATTTNPSPITPHVAVLESAVSTMNFQIDRVSDLSVRTVGPSVDGSFSDDFIDMSKIGAGSNIAVTAGEVVLSGSVGSYVSLGSIESTSISPSIITAWDTINWNAGIPTNTSLKIQLYSVSGANIRTLIPDADMPGNSVGFTAGPINISTLDIATYPTLSLSAVLTSSDVNSTPSVQDWEIAYIISEPPIGNVPFILTSTKIIGSTPTYKYEESHTTDGSGEVQLTGLEWDFYTVSLTTGAYDIEKACVGNPYTLNPGVDETLTLTLVPATASSLRVSVLDTVGNPITGAEVNVSRSGFSDSGATGTCGQKFFNVGLVTAPDYTVVVQKSGYVDQTITDIAIDGTNALRVVLIEI